MLLLLKKPGGSRKEALSYNHNLDSDIDVLKQLIFSAFCSGFTLGYLELESVRLSETRTSGLRRF